MKILYITLENLSLHKGSVVHIKEVVTGLRKLGHLVDLIACSRERSEVADNFYNLQRFPRRKKQPYLISSILLFIYLFKILPRFNVIYARDYHTVIIAFIPRLFFKKELVFEINGLANEEQGLKGGSIFNRILSSLIRVAEKAATTLSDKIVSVTPQIAAYLKDQFDCSVGKIEVVSNGVNINIFHPIRNEAILMHWKQKLGISSEEVIITFVGNLAPWQGVEYLIQVAEVLIPEIKNIKFLIIGSGALKKEFEAEVKRSGLSHHFVFTGMVHYNQIPFYINIADICVTLKKRLKSGYSPIKLYEYMACGKPVVASRVKGLEFLELEGAGRLIEPGNVKALEEALQDLCANKEKRINMGLKGLKIARERFTWDSRVIGIEKILKELA